MTKKVLRRILLVKQCTFIAYRGIAVAFDPLKVDQKWIQICKDDENRFDPGKKCFSMVLPPPNVTGSLHLGHALTVAVQDSLLRWHKMHGENIVWVPGCDHAGIATQAVVERHLLAAEGKRRSDITREEFLKYVFDWKNSNEAEIYKQLQRLSPLLDWNRKVFTMDPDMSKAVNEAFIRLYEDGLVYRKSSLTFWCIALQTSLSDIEVDYLHIDSPKNFLFPDGSKKVSVTLGKMYDLAYKFVNSDDEIVFSTTRPETALGDVALAVNPADPLHKDFIGRKVIQPMTGKPIPVIGDPSVDMKFGTGVVKITPAHDLLDLEIAERNGLPSVRVIDWDGRMVNVPERYQAMPRFTARKAVLEEFKQLGLFRGERNHRTSVPVCSRSGDLLEMMIRPQWFVSCKPLAEQAIKLVESGELKLIPEYHSGAWFEFLRNIRDWCVSRQLWWGHRVPMFKVEGVSDWFPARSLEEARDVAKKKYGKDDVIQDEDVLDTWFSSSLFPFAVFGWPKKTEDLSTYFPLSLMETGSDILFFWVARMVMMSCYLTGKSPFEEVLLHGMICDSEGKKMSKSKGNVIDPLDVMDGITKEELESKAIFSFKNGIISKEELESALIGIKKNFPAGIKPVGSDGLRLALCAHDVKSGIIKVDLDHIVSHRQFLNKPWQTVRYLFMNLERLPPSPGPCSDRIEDPVNRWIIGRMYEMLRKVDTSFKNYDLHLVTKAIIQFIHFELCDIYVECTKPVFKNGSVEESYETISTLVRCLDVGIRALVPFAPSFSNELYMELHAGLREKRFAIDDWTVYDRATLSRYPAASEWSQFEDVSLDASMAFARQVVKSIRASKASYGVTKFQPRVSLQVCSEDDVKRLQPLASVVTTLARAESLTIFGPKAEIPGVDRNCVRDVLPNGATVFVHIQGMVDVSEEMPRFEKKLRKLKNHLASYEKALDSLNDLKKLKISKETCLTKAENARREIQQIEEQIRILQNLLK